MNKRAQRGNVLTTALIFLNKLLLRQAPQNVCVDKIGPRPRGIRCVDKIRISAARISLYRLNPDLGRAKVFVYVKSDPGDGRLQSPQSPRILQVKSTTDRLST